jgi:hypothetical protein
MKHGAPPGGLVRRVRAEAAFIVVLVVVLAGLVGVVAFPRHWLRGVLIVAAGFGLATLLRLVLGKRQAGLLAVRGRAFDALCYLLSCVAITVFAVLLPR